MNRRASLLAPSHRPTDALTATPTYRTESVANATHREPQSSGVRCLGIIGGLGPVATAGLYLNVCQLVHATEHVTPAIVVDSVRMPRAIEEAFVATVPCAENEDALRDIIGAAVARLAAAGAGAVCAACNTVQPLVMAEAARLGIGAISMVEATVAAARRKGYRSALVLGAASACRLDVYGSVARTARLALTYPSALEQKEISRAILELTHERATSSVTSSIAAICRRYEQRVDCILLGCTDLSQVCTESLAACPVVDSLTELGVAAAAFLRDDA